MPYLGTYSATLHVKKRPMTTCKHCHGIGRVNGQPCPNCTGTGRIGPFEFKVEGEASEVQRVAQSFIEQWFEHMATKKTGSSCFEENWQKLTAACCGFMLISVMIVIGI